MAVSDEHSDQNGTGLALHGLEGIDTDVNNDERKTLESQNTVENDKRRVGDKQMLETSTDSYITDVSGKKVWNESKILSLPRSVDEGMISMSELPASSDKDKAMDKSPENLNPNHKGSSQTHRREGSPQDDKDNKRMEEVDKNKAEASTKKRIWSTKNLSRKKA